MDAETLYTINGGQLVALTPGPAIPRGIGAAIAANLDSFVANPGLAIGSWDQTVQRDRPAVMSFTATGTVVSVVVSNMDDDDAPVAERITAIHRWMAPMQLRDLSQLFPDPGSFYEGLWDMSPNATIALQDERRYVVVTADRDTEALQSVQADLGNATIEFVHLDVFTSELGDDPIIRWSASNGDELSPPRLDLSELPDTTVHNTVVTPPAPETASVTPVDVPDDSEASDADATEASAVSDIDVRETIAPATVAVAPLAPETVAFTPASPMDNVVDLTSDDEPEIDLDELETQPVDVSADSSHPGHVASGVTFVPGRTYDIGSLPLLFDPNDDLLESISDEMFGVPGHLVLVDKLPERRRQPSPFENPGRYRWDATTELQTMLESHSIDHTGARSVHLFVESDRQPGLATYVGLLTTAADNQAGRYSTSLWFDITPKVSAPLWQLFRKGRLPELHDSTALDPS
jgi:hypothetical protein